MKTRVLLVFIVLLALLLRVCFLDRYPTSLYGDEQAFAWNAYNILKTGQDEFGVSFPLQFRSFGDNKSPLPVYLLVPFLWIFGMDAFSIRLPIVIASVLTVFLSFFLFRHFVSQKSALLASFLFSISPWHIHLSRGFFESTLGLLFLVWGTHLFVLAVLHPHREKYYPISHLLFAFSLYSYFTPRIFLLFFLPFLSFWAIRFHRKYFSFTHWYLSIFLLFFLSLPLIKLTVFDNGYSRFHSLLRSHQSQIERVVVQERSATMLPPVIARLFHNKLTVWMRETKNNFLEHLSLNFWYLTGDSSLRYFLGNMGMFYLFELPFFLLGLSVFLREKPSSAFLLIGWILFSCIPASIVGRPFAVRSLSLLPVPFLFVSYGVSRLLRFFRNSAIIATSIVFLSSLSLCVVLIRYYFEYSLYAATWWGWENKTAIAFAQRWEDTYDALFISDFYTGATLAYAVYTSYDPLLYREAVSHPVVLADGRHLIQLGRYYFGSLDIDAERFSEHIIPPNSLYIARPEEFPSDESIRAPGDGRVLFYIYRTGASLQ